MQLFNKCSIVLPLMISLMLFGCGGGSSDEGGNVLIGGNTPSGGVFGGGGTSGGDEEGGDTTDPATGNPSTSVSGVSYRPLVFREGYDEFSGQDVGGSLNAIYQFPLIKTYFINPIDASTLASTDTAVVSDYVATIDGVEIDANESHPILQKVIGTDIQLLTALVFDLSASTTAAGVNVQALVDEAKAYVDAAQASSDKTIANQNYVVWAFASQIDELTTGFTSDNATIDAALDAVVTNYNSQTLGTSSNLNRAVVEVVGRYIDDDGIYNFSADGDNDLIDATDFTGGSGEAVYLSQIVMFVTGPDSKSEMSTELLAQAISSQTLLRYDTEAAATSNETVGIPKPVFYYAVGGSSSAGTVYSVLQDNSEVFTALSLVAGSYSFTSNLIQNQQASVQSRFNSSGQYLYRFDLLPRAGDHILLFSSKTAGYNYTITSEFEDGDLNPALGNAEEEINNVNTFLVEIAGPNGEYIAGDSISFSEAQTFTPMTLWTSGTYGPSDYSWSIIGGSFTPNADGSVTVNPIIGASAILQLTNNAIVAANPSATLTITND